MDEETVLTWTVANWITVCLMVLLGFAVLGFGGRALTKAGIGKRPNAAA